jgi:hypothetical protein
MCMEDILIGRKSRAISNYGTIRVGVATQFVPRNANRIALMLGSALTSGIYYSLDSSVNVTGHGFFVPVQSSPLIFNISQHGDLARCAWFGIADTVDCFVSYLEVVLDIEQASQLHVKGK